MTQPDHQDATQLMEDLREAAKKMTPQDRMRQRIEYAVMSTAPDDREAQNRIRRQLDGTSRANLADNVIVSAS